MVKKPRPARRLFGRPKEAPGPQQVFQGEFQVTPGQGPSPSQQRPFRLRSPARSGSSSTASGTVRAAPGPAQSHRRGGSGSPSGSGARHSRGGSASTLSSREDHARGDGGGGADMPARRCRPSTTGHGTTVVPTIQAASGNFSRSRAHNVLTSDIISALNSNEAGPSSSAAVQAQGSPSAEPGPSAFHQPASTRSGTSGIYSPNGQASPASDLSSGGVTSAGYRRRQPLYELPDTSPSVRSPSLYTSPAVTPRTPNSFGGTSVPASVCLELSPLLDFAVGNLSPDMLAADFEELPPLTPDEAIDRFPSFELRPRANSSSYVSGPSHGALGMSSVANRSSISVPELGGLLWPVELFYSGDPGFPQAETAGNELTLAPSPIESPLPGPPSASRSASGGPHGC
ncbi:hypothetical protein PYCCODRAFT_1475779 [Trametes coccinea BRFM310]|uniref:Uncharacterized protein n=1 Tax=Trametes coccinea (strain BRFM310) TaxID=1353009 RepID=A0A1Y2IVQ5_TRAC3|nr:hypothetical protein PYCCODRAFT_1475779 [Trametes coccinea BRFM310]